MATVVIIKVVVFVTVSVETAVVIGVVDSAEVDGVVVTNSVVLGTLEVVTVVD